MKDKKYTPSYDLTYLSILGGTALIMLAATILCFLAPLALITVIPADLLVIYFFVSPLFGYAELRENTLFIRFGFFLKREIPYEKIRRAEKQRKFYSDSMLALKTSLNHVNIRYNSFDILSVSIKNEDEFIEELERRRLGLNQGATLPGV